MDYEYERALTLATYTRPQYHYPTTAPAKARAPQLEYPTYERPKLRRDKGYSSNRLQSWTSRRPYIGKGEADDRVGLLTDYDIPHTVELESGNSGSSIVGPDLTLAKDNNIIELDCQEISEPSFAALAASLVASIARSDACGSSFVVMALSGSSIKEPQTKKADRLQNLVDALQGKVPDPPPPYRQAVQEKEDDVCLAALYSRIPVFPSLQEPKTAPKLKRRRGVRRQRLAREMREVVEFTMRPLTWADVKADAKRYLVL